MKNDRKKTRKLTIHRTTLRQLDAADLERAGARVAGGGNTLVVCQDQKDTTGTSVSFYC